MKYFICLKTVLYQIHIQRYHKAAQIFLIIPDLWIMLVQCNLKIKVTKKSMSVYNTREKIVSPVQI